MTIREDFEARIRQARKDGDERTKNVINLIKNNVLTQLKSGKGVKDDDALWLSAIAAYAKQVQKSIPEFEKAGERGVEALEEARFERTFCEQFLPTKLDEAATEALVRRLIEEQGIAGPQQMGKLMGVLMKNHRDEVDGALARTIAQRVLAG
ncbi:MAG: GatB/YqeY domain-containing protein [Deltaproteobacteria bacterium]|nr:GatB/YqeY domain-containing protein [Deltaproteobacteria bacterium]